MYFSGMKRSLPCLELTSMEDIDSNPLLQMVNSRWNLGEDNDSALVEASSLSKKQRLLPSNACPASSALESFLRFAVDDLTPLSGLLHGDVWAPPSQRQTKTCSLVFRKLEHHAVMPSIHDVTRGMARISASN